MPFQELVGHQRLVRLLSRAVARGSLPPSLIFAGPAGVGKRLAAVALAQAVNCLAPVTADPDDVEGRERPGGTRPAGARALAFEACGQCRACRRIERGLHTDVLTIEPGESGSIKIEQVREAIDRAAYRPFEGRRRVVIIDEADAMVTEAQNALLKTLEEPPPASLFVLVTARPDMLLATVRSRCPRLRFGRLSASDIARVLVERHGYRDAEARASAATADGSLRRALAQESGELADARDGAHQLLSELAGRPDPRARLATARELAGAGSGSRGADREAVKLRLRALASLLRDVELISTRADDGWLANADLKPELEALAQSYGGKRTVRAFSAVDRALWALERNASPKVVADWLAFQL